MFEAADEIDRSATSSQQEHLGSVDDSFVSVRVSCLSMACFLCMYVWLFVVSVCMYAYERCISI